jgi:hypothetical protein
LQESRFQKGRPLHSGTRRQPRRRRYRRPKGRRQVARCVPAPAYPAALPVTGRLNHSGGRISRAGPKVCGLVAGAKEIRTLRPTLDASIPMGAISDVDPPVPLA